MKTSDFFYNLPQTSIAQFPIEPRESCKLAVLDRLSGRVEHAVFSSLGKFLKRGDCLVLNNSKVLPLRVPCRKTPTGAAVEVLLLKAGPGPDGLMPALLKPGRRAKAGTKLAPVRASDPDFMFLVEGKDPEGVYFLRWTGPKALDLALLEQIGLPPLPPYIRREYFSQDKPDAWDKDRLWYQTVFADPPGSAAAPTAGLHFSPAMLDKLRQDGILIARVTLHVGMGTFLPVKEDDPQKHVIHEEEYEINADACLTINQARENSGRIIAVGTTSLRVVESACDDQGQVFPRIGKTRLYILPGYRFKIAGGLLTNFHIPQSTLIMLVAALDNTRRVLSLYEECLALKYRFLSYGDAMLVL